MNGAKIAISLDSEALKQVDQLVEEGLFPSRSRLIQDAVAEKLQRVRQARLARECAKLQLSIEQAAAEELFRGEAEWPEYCAVATQPEVIDAPTMANGKICYIEIPAVDIQRSAEFYENAFGWKTRRRGDGALAFDDGLDQVSGSWVLGRPPVTSPGLLIYIMVDSVEATTAAVLAHGGEIVQPIGVDAPEITARFRDPAGNVLGLYQQRG
jgi:uncharacterized protein